MRGAWDVRGRQSRIPYIIALILGVLLFLVSGIQQGQILTDLLFSLASGCLIVGFVRLLGNMKMFASLNWGTRMLKRVFLNKVRSGREESEDYANYRNSRGRNADALPLLIASAVLAVLSLIAVKLP